MANAMESDQKLTFEEYLREVRGINPAVAGDGDSDDFAESLAEETIQIFENALRSHAP